MYCTSCTFVSDIMHYKISSKSQESMKQISQSLHYNARRKKSSYFTQEDLFLMNLKSLCNDQSTKLVLVLKRKHTWFK